MNEPEYPPLPEAAFSHLGPVKVLHTDLSGEGLHGSFAFYPRTISIHAEQHPAVAWSTYWHEVVHLALFDAGTKLPEAIEERVADALGTYFAAAVRSGFLKVNPNEGVPAVPNH